jgi:hypothetical protein
MTIKKHLGTINILIKDRQMHAKDVQKILTKNGHLIRARLGLNIEPRCIENCTGLISVIIEGTAKEIEDITKQLDKLYGIVAKYNILTD